MKLTFILPQYTNQPRGGYKIVYEYANNLQDRGHQVTVIHPTALLPLAREPLLKSVQRIEVNWFPLHSDVQLLLVPDLCEMFIPDGDAIFATAWQTAPWVNSYASSKGRKFYLIQDYETWDGPKAEVNATWKLPLHKVVIASWLMELAQGFGETTRTTYIPCAIDVSHFKQTIPIAERRERWVGMPAHTAYWKGTLDGLKALELVKAQVSDLNSVLFGTQARSPQIPEWIEYIQLPSPAELVALYNLCTIFMQPSWTEGWGLTTSEAMACGCALVTTDNGGSREYAVPDVTALVAPIKDPSMLANQLLRLLKDDALRQRIAARGYEHIQQFTWSRAVEAIENLLVQRKTTVIVGTYLQKVSIFTGTNNPKYLHEAYESIKSQNFDEWIILPNNGARSSDIPREIVDDHRVKILEYKEETKIGALKKLLCSRCTGDIIVELDHDDLLIPPAIDKIREAFMDPEVVLAYSNYAEFHDHDRSPRPFDSNFGWKQRDFYYKGYLYKEVLTPRPTPYHASIVHWAPNHVRAFRKSAYDAVAGHNERLNVCDDQDLMCKLYLQGKFFHIGQCLYLYRVYGQNTWIQRNNEIQEQAPAIQKKYLHAMIETWAKRNGYEMIVLGGRHGKPPGYNSVNLKNADIIADLNGRYPFEDSSVGVVRAFDFLQLFKDQVHTMSEIYRILIPGGYFLSMTPSTTGPNGESGMGSYQDPSHVSYWNRNSFWYYTRNEQAKYINNKTIRFFPIILENCFPSDWHKENFIPYVRADLIALKGDERPMGRIEI